MARKAIVAISDAEQGFSYQTVVCLLDLNALQFCQQTKLYLDERGEERWNERTESRRDLGDFTSYIKTVAVITISPIDSAEYRKWVEYSEDEETNIFTPCIILEDIEV